MFKKLPSLINFPEMEEEILKFWKDNDTFKKSLEIRKGSPRFNFYEGPPTANGKPHAGHVLPRIYKDLFPRYKTMQGYYVPRKAGWDTHGLPVELEVEKELGLNSKQDIEKYGVEEFNKKCKESVFRYEREWRRFTERIGFWIDMDNPYITLSNDYIESVWWLIKKIWEKGLLYKGYKIVPWCPRCETALSDHEVAQGYKETEDPSIFVKFRVKDQENTYFLAWTTTPWTLISNVALAVHPEEEYVKVKHNNEYYILAEKRLPYIFEEGTYEIVEKKKGKEIEKAYYEPLFTFLPVDKDAYYVVLGDFVTLEDGTGIVHIAPAFGDEDFQLGKKYDLPFLQPVDQNGKFIKEIKPWAGMFIKKADPLIIEYLKERNLLLKEEKYTHTYPFCWRCDTPLIYYARSSWYIKTTAIKEDLLNNNRKINWYPEHIKEGRFGNWLANNIDWALSRERYWGTPLPIWVCDSCGHEECIGSYEELGITDTKNFDPHKPYIDQITLKCPKCGGTMHRVPEVIDCWFDSGAMPVAQWHYPFENQEEFKASFPADFICEAIDQTRGWFYSLLAISTLVFNEPAYKNVLVTELVLDEKGEKMSKHKGNVVDPWIILNKYGADALRWYIFTVSPPWVPLRFAPDAVNEALKKFLLTLWNTVSFFSIYAEIDGFDPNSHFVPFNELEDHSDKWIISRLNSLIVKVKNDMENFNATQAARSIQSFVIDDLSNWYIRLNRERFWKSEKDKDKWTAYTVTYTVIKELSKLIAPFIPFTAEKIYQEIVRVAEKNSPESVHLCDYPEEAKELIDTTLEENMEIIKEIVTAGRMLRNQANIKIRQPLSKIWIKVDPKLEKDIEALKKYVQQELNVEEVIMGSAESKEGVLYHKEDAFEIELDTKLTEELLNKGILRELEHKIQMLRKEAKLDYTDRIKFYYEGSQRIKNIIENNKEEFAEEILAIEIKEGNIPDSAYKKNIKVYDEELTVGFEKA
ncbi:MULTISPECIES: isoleucine--tRNA ligase [Dictyoglomus]|uniref:Isoleucine--tRNA ligase n=1 Tax=Dictyoglomus turgidum (strain DSM 6724 / Z-1310) TaxID=515635 RepID=B8E0W6_DICTD|nr:MULTISPECIES: isoleucine--tRNA ligase [Dictyoglomus]ACK42703.1 isoleucyl-tRNA synthetase [Dictyoglomus turgidum DSM 6724]HBU30762.1 isoleucine--tRNA ligase [Dictyoglomus sp.]